MQIGQDGDLRTLTTSQVGDSRGELLVKQEPKETCPFLSHEKNGRNKLILIAGTKFTFGRDEDSTNLAVTMMPFFLSRETFDLFIKHYGSMKDTRSKKSYICP